MNAKQLIQLKWSMRKDARSRHPVVVEKPRMSMTPFWGNAAQPLAKRLTGSTNRDAAWRHYHPKTKAEILREKIVAGYHNIMGAHEGGSVQKAIAAFNHISDREPWCAEGFWYVVKKLAGYNGPAPDNCAYVPAWELFAQKHGILVKFTSALSGMGVTFCWDGKRQVGGGDHIGVVHKTGILKHTIRYNPTTDEANAGGAGGDAVREVTRYWYQINTIFDIAKLQK